MGWPQITLLAMWAVGLGVHLARNGEPYRQLNGEPARYSFWSRLIATGVWVGLLWAGGFFDGMGPQD